MATPCSSSNAGDRPYVLVNMAMTADGKIASADRSIHTFGSPRDTRHLYELRATADAILCGARTVEDTGATLGNGGDRFRRMRLKHGLAEFPLRVIVSGRGSISPDAPLWQHRFSPILVLTTAAAPARARKHLTTLADQVWTTRSRHLDYATALRRLHGEFGVRRLLVEGGAEVNAGLFEASLVDEVNVTLCPLILGGRTSPTIAAGPGMKLADAARFHLTRRRQVGSELFLTYHRHGLVIPGTL